MPLIYRKTAKGLTEIETRAHRLPPRLRSALILVDGRRDVNDLKPLIMQQAEETLSSLAEQGFIEAVGETARSASPPPAPAPAPSASATTAGGNDFDSTRRAAVRHMVNAVKRIERADASVRDALGAVLRKAAGKPGPGASAKPGPDRKPQR